MADEKDMDEFMSKAEEALRANLSKEQLELLERSERMTAEMLGVSDFDEFAKLTKNERRKRSKEMNEKLFSMMGVSKEELLEREREAKEQASRERIAGAKNADKKLIAEIGKLAKNVIFIKPFEEGAEIKTGQSKIGGKPHLPQGFKWYRNGEGTPLSFLMQINFAETREYDKDNIFPEKGILYLFYDVENQPWDTDDDDGKGFAVYYYDGDISELEPADFPDEYEDDCCGGVSYVNCLMDERAVSFFSEKDAPDYEDFAELSGTAAEENYEDAKTAFLGYDSYKYSEDYFKLGGYSNIIQNGLAEEFGEDHIQLCQLTTYDKGERGFMFGDGGNLYFYISRKDLAEKRFDDVKISLQCY